MRALFLMLLLAVSGCASVPVVESGQPHGPIFSQSELKTVPIEVHYAKRVVCSESAPAAFVAMGCSFIRDGVHVIYIRKGLSPEMARDTLEHEEAHALGMHHGPWWPGQKNMCAVVTDPGRTYLVKGELLCVPLMDLH